MIVDLLEDYYRAEAEKSVGKRRNVFRASSAGYCERRLGYEKLGIAGEPIQPRRAAVFKHGHMIDRALKHDLKRVLGDRFLNLDRLGKNYCTIEGVKVSFTPDGAFQIGNDIGIVEIKSMSDFAYERARDGDIEHTYLCQAWVYHYGTSFNPIVFLAYRKETSHVCEVVFDRSATEKVVTQRFNGDPLELVTDDPLLRVTIRTPFDASVETEVREKFARLAKVKTEAEIAPRLVLNDRGEPVVRPEEVKVHGAVATAEYEKVHNQKPVEIKKGGWATFHTGRLIAGFPCSYCQWIRRCRGAALDFTGSSDDPRPLWILDENFF